MIRVSQRVPKDNVTLIESYLGSAGMFNCQSTNGITVNTKMKQTNARMINVPTLSYRNQDKTDRDSQGRSGQLRRGRWDLRGQTFKRPGNMAVLGVIEIGGARASPEVYEKLTETLRMHGLKCNAKVSVAKCSSVSHEDLQEALEDVEQREGFRPARFLLILLPNKIAVNYESVKWWADTVAGAHTVCVTKDNVSMRKAGGHNHTLVQAELDYMHQGGETMFVGADVTHPGPGSSAHCPSIAAVVASDDRYAVNYPGSLRLQRCKQESIEDLDSMMIDRLEAWYAKNRSAPKNILFYRDGVSESQFAMVKNQELPKITDAFVEFGKKHPELGNYNPGITLVVCGKRHHTRFYPPAQVQNTYRAVDHNSNFRPGLVVDDTSIRNPFRFDFYLQSHAALKGTARPCHYFVIHNGMGLSANKLQRITNNLCWTFARALTPISYASPAYYADRLAERGRCYMAPFISATYPAKPKESTLLGGLADAENSTMEDEDMHVLAKIKGGLIPRTRCRPPGLRWHTCSTVPLRYWRLR
ncbi:hypothetical protein BST61_g2831 [Cercospora zeina]